MRAFKRTSSGLENQHLFYKVDIVVYVEGGSRSYSKEEVYAGMYSTETEDIIFWRNIFSHFKSVEQIKYKSIGSKSTIKEIASDIVTNNIKTIFVAMDCEFDEIHHNKIIHKNIFYTYGYSYENDVWNDVVIKAIIEDLSAIDIVEQDIKLNFYNFIRDIKIAVYADAYMFKRNESFFPRKTGYLFCIDCNCKYLPLVRKDELAKKMNVKCINKQTLYSYGHKNKIDTLRYCFGHLLADYCCQVVTCYLKNKHGLTSLRKDIIYRMGIKKYFSLCFSTGSIYAHYNTQFSR